MSDRIVMIPPYKVLSRVSILAETVDYNHKLMNVPAMWKRTKGEGVKLVILDTGIPNHIDLKPQGGKSFISGYREDRNGHGCVAPNTLVHTNFCGVETIEKLYSRVEVPEQEWQSPDGSRGIVKDVRNMGLKTFSLDVGKGETVIGDIQFLHKTPFSGSVISLDIEGCETLVLTPWHPVPIQRRNAHGDKYFEKVRADMVIAGDHLVSPSANDWISEKTFSFNGASKWRCESCEHVHTEKRKHGSDSEHRCSQCGKRNSLVSFASSYLVTENMAYLMGLIWTDGSLTETVKGTTVTVASESHELTEAASRISNEAGFGSGSYYDRGGVRIWRNHRKDFFVFLLNAGFESGREKAKSLPQFVGKSTRAVAAAFIAGMIDGDGHVSPEMGRPSNIVVSDSNVAESLKSILNALGMRTSVFGAKSRTFGSEGKTRNGNQLYYCRFSHIDSEVRGFLRHEEKIQNAGLVRRCQRSVYRVKGTSSREYNGVFYDFTVRDFHTYVANGVFTSNTHCGGIVAGISNNGLGIAGIAPDVEDYYGAVLDENGSGEISEIVAGIRWAVDEVGAQVISMSLGIPEGYPNIRELEEACNYARAHGSLVVAAAGNEAGGVGQPARYDSVIAIAAVDSKKKRAWFSNRGPEIDFAAGGVDVYSTYLKNGYAKLSGTSMACPAFAAMCALVIADEKKDHDRWLSPEEVIDKMKKIAFDVGSDGFDESFGNGIPVFSNIDDPGDQPIPEPQPEPPSGKKSGGIPCPMVWALISAFGEAAGKAARSGATPDGAILAGLKGIGKMAEKLESASEG